MIHIRQPDGKLCGQCCLAMLAGTPLATAISAVGHRRRTTNADIQRGLRSLGFTHGPTRRAEKNIYLPDLQLPQVAIVKLAPKDQSRTERHWMLWCNGAFHDPARPPGSATYGRIVSYIEVTPEEEAHS